MSLTPQVCKLPSAGPAWTPASHGCFWQVSIFTFFSGVRMQQTQQREPDYGAELSPRSSKGAWSSSWTCPKRCHFESLCGIRSIYKLRLAIVNNSERAEVQRRVPSVTMHATLPCVAAGRNVDGGRGSIAHSGSSLTNSLSQCPKENNWSTTFCYGLEEWNRADEAHVAGDQKSFGQTVFRSINKSVWVTLQISSLGMT